MLPRMMDAPIVVEIAVGHRLHRAAGADGHERGRLDGAVRSLDHAGARAAVLVGHAKAQGARHQLTIDDRRLTIVNP